MTAAIRKAALIGGGVIGGGWAGRLIENGVDVTIYDPHPASQRRVDAMLANAARAWSLLTLAPRTRKGRVAFAASIAEAVRDADFIQESVPEDEAIKRKVLAEIDAHALPDAPVCSSTSGLLPSRLQSDMKRAERMLVAHPFNPVYLLPLVEICPGERTSPAAVARAVAIYDSLGMKPLRIRKEIGGFVADRLLEALWREALWLVHDDIATTEEVDDAIRYGAGLRWAQMGTFLVYRIAGGEEGMRHFMAQFGPTLKFPWTKLMDVPELTDAFLDKITAQSDRQAAGLTVDELERLRDDNLIAILQALRTHDYAAGGVLKRHEARLFGSAHAAAASSAIDPSQPLTLYSDIVRPEWIDYNGHMTESRYLEAFGHATDAVLLRLGVDAAYRGGGYSFYTVETHLHHLKEIAALEPFAVDSQILHADDKRFVLFHTMRHGGSAAPLATAEHMLIHVDTAAGRACPTPAPISARLRDQVEAHRALPWPERAGRLARAPARPEPR
jgi:carnitine 3-dehydrogenase / betainyl-CoA thioesterase